MVASGLWDLLPGGRPSSPYGEYTPRSMQGARFLLWSLLLLRQARRQVTVARCLFVGTGGTPKFGWWNPAGECVMTKTCCRPARDLRVTSSARAGKTPFTENGKSGAPDGRPARPGAPAAAGPPKPRRRPPPAPPGAN